MIPGDYRTPSDRDERLQNQWREDVHQQWNAQPAVFVGRPLTPEEKRAARFWAIALACSPFAFVAVFLLHGWAGMEFTSWSVGLGVGAVSAAMAGVVWWIGLAAGFVLRKTWKVFALGLLLAGVYHTYWLHPGSMLASVASRVLWLGGGLWATGAVYSAVGKRSRGLAVLLSAVLGFFVLTMSCATIVPAPR